MAARIIRDNLEEHAEIVPVSAAEYRDKVFAAFPPELKSTNVRACDTHVGTVLCHEVPNPLHPPFPKGGKRGFEFDQNEICT